MIRRRDLQKLHTWQQGQLEERIKRMHKLVMRPHSLPSTHPHTHPQHLHPPPPRLSPRFIFVHFSFSTKTKNREPLWFFHAFFRPPVRFSKNLLEWKSSEKHLARLKQFTEAKALNKRIAVLEPQELAAHEMSWINKLKALRQKLRRRQDFEVRKGLTLNLPSDVQWCALPRAHCPLITIHSIAAIYAQVRKLDEKLHDLTLRAQRDGDRSAMLNDQRLKNHQTDMQHAHIVDRNQLPEYCKHVFCTILRVLTLCFFTTATSLASNAFTPAVCNSL